MTKRLLIVDDDSRFRGLLRMLLEDEPQFEVVGEAREGADALEAARELAPDVVLLDVNLPDGVGFDLVPRLDATVVMTSSRDDDGYALLAHEAGAAGFVSKHDLSAAAIARFLDDED
jgi:DNA-binding NarL/FixJ family response regulator